MTRVVITGLGVVSPLGCDADTFWEGLAAGKSGISRIEAFDASGLKNNIAGIVHGFSPEAAGLGKDARRMDRFAQFAVVAAGQAFADAGIEPERLERRRAGAYIGTGVGGLGTLLENHRTLLERGPGRVSPVLIPMMIANMAAAQISIRFGLKGPTLAPVTACASGNNAIGEAFKLIQRGGADLIVAGGAEAVIADLALAGFGNATTLSTRTDDPARASRPFDSGRDGFVPSEGAGVLILESLEHAQARGARVLAEVTGYGAASDAYHIVASDPEGAGAAEAMRVALADAGLRPEEVGHINAHATSTPLGDRAEAAAIREVFGALAERIPLTANKSMLGHMLGAAGGVEAVALVQTLRHGLIPPTINAERIEEGLGLDIVAGVARRADIRHGLSNSFGFGGHNAVLIFSRWEG